MLIRRWEGTVKILRTGGSDSVLQRCSRFRGRAVHPSAERRKWTTLSRRWSAHAARSRRWGYARRVRAIVGVGDTILGRLRLPLLLLLLRLLLLRDRRRARQLLRRSLRCLHWRRQARGALVR